jgi:hypothetical protein
MFLAFIVVCLLAVAPAFAASPCTTPPYSCSQYHHFTDRSDSPYVESIELTSKNIGSTYTTILAGCTDPALGVPGTEIRGTATFNLLVRVYIQVTGVSGAPSGARYHLQLLVDGIEIAGATKVTRQDPSDPTKYLLPHAELIAGTAQNLSAGNHNYEVRARMLDGGTLTVRDISFHAHGIPTAKDGVTLSGGRLTGSSQLFIGTTDTEITPRLRITNNNAVAFDILPQAYFQYEGGTPGTQVNTKFKLKSTTTATEYVTGTSSVYVPCAVISGGVCTFPDGPRDSAEILGRIMSVPPGSWDLFLVGNAPANANTKVAWRHIEYLGLPPQSTRDTNGDGISGAVRVKAGAVGTTNVYVMPQGTSAQPQDPLLNDGQGAWTQILGFGVPKSELNADQNWTGAAYLHLVGRGIGDWSNSSIDIALEGTTGGGIVHEFGYWHTAMPPGGTTGGSGFYFPVSAMLWGNDVANGLGYGNTITMWVRKTPTGTPTNATFTVGYRYVDYKLTPAENSCYEYNP